MPNEAVGIQAGMSIKKQTLDDKGKVTKTVFFFPDLSESAEAETIEEAREIAEAKKKEKEKKSE
jgi:hypothetical protein